MMSDRGSRPKIVSGRVTEPASLPSSVVTFISMSRTPPALLANRDRGGSRIIGKAEFARLGYTVRKLLLHRIAYRDPAALDAGYGALDQDQSALNVRLHHFQIERGHSVDTEMARHFLILEGLPGILPAAGRTDRAMRDGDTVGRTQTGEIPALHTTREALAGRGAGHVHILADHEMIGGDLRSHRNQRVIIDTKLGEPVLGLDLGDGEVTAIRSVGALRLADTGTEL